MPDLPEQPPSTWDQLAASLRDTPAPYQQWAADMLRLVEHLRDQCAYPAAAQLTNGRLRFSGSDPTDPSGAVRPPVGIGWFKTGVYTVFLETTDADAHIHLTHGQIVTIDGVCAALRQALQRNQQVSQQIGTARA